MIEAAAVGNLPELQSLLGHGVSANARFRDGYTALVAAAQNRQPEALRALIAADANLQLTEEHGRTALMLAACEALPAVYDRCNVAAEMDDWRRSRSVLRVQG